MAFGTLDHKILSDKMKCIDFSDKAIKWFYSYLTNRVIFVSLGTAFLEERIINRGVLEGIFSAFLLQAFSNTNTYLYTDDTSILCQHKDVTEIENVLNKEFANVCGCFVDNKLSIHFGEDKTKRILFSRDKNLSELNVTYNNNRIKQYRMVE